jgi:hypothetical protein
VIEAERRIEQAEEFDKREGISDSEMATRMADVQDSKKRKKQETAAAAVDGKGFKIPKFRA